MQRFNKHIFIFLIAIAMICGIALKVNQKEVVESVSAQSEVMESYLLYQNKLVCVPTSTSQKKSSDKMKEIITYMKQKLSDFDNILNESTQLDDVSVKNKIMNINFEVLEYDTEKELRVLESIIYSATQFDDVDSVKIKVKGELLEKMPMNQTPIATTREFGINHLQSNQMYLHEGKQITLTYLTTIHDTTYQVLQSIPVRDVKNYDEILTLMFTNVNVNSYLVQPLANERLRTTQKSELKKDVIHLYLNKNVLDENKVIKKNVLKYLKLNLKQFKEIKYISIHVDGKVISVKGKNKITI